MCEYFLGFDNYDGDITDKIEIKNTKVERLGDLTLELILKDSSGNETNLMVNAFIIDNKNPVIKLKNNSITVDILDFAMLNNDYFLELIEEISDNYTNNTDLIIDIDYSSLKEEVGDYEVYYSVTDESGNNTKIKLDFSLREMVGPKIIADDFYNFTIGTQVDLKSLVTVYDPYDFSAYLRLEIVENDYNPNKKGTYHVTYRVYNSSGLYSLKTITINVSDIDVKNNNIYNWQEGSQIKKFIQNNVHYLLLIVLSVLCLTILINKRRKK